MAGWAGFRPRTWRRTSDRRPNPRGTCAPRAPGLGGVSAGSWAAGGLPAGGPVPRKRLDLTVLPRPHPVEPALLNAEPGFPFFSCAIRQNVRWYKEAEI